MAMTAAERLIKDGQQRFLDWVNGDLTAKDDIESMLADDVHLIDYDDGTDVSNKADALKHLSDIVERTQSVYFYRNRSVGQTVVGLDHLAYKPLAKMKPHDCVDLFEVNAGATKVTKVNICFVKT